MGIYTAIRTCLCTLGQSSPGTCRCADESIVWLCSCFTSPIRRARRFAELAWSGREGPLIPMHTLKEAHLGWLQGMRQGVHIHKFANILPPWRFSSIVCGDCCRAVVWRGISGKLAYHWLFIWLLLVCALVSLCVFGLLASSCSCKAPFLFLCVLR